ncbi:MAG: NADH-quinone oxidoreductase subunit N, partial [Pseudomonadota bacterium]|nr:NADH-quinone oxidoreductase subunit N [Pseudomonadota bacterium]
MTQSAALAQFAPLLPEITLSIGAMLILMAGVFRKETSGDWANWCAIGLLAVTAFLVLRLGGAKFASFEGAFITDGFSRLMKLLTLVGAAVVLFMSAGYMRDAKLMKFEFPVLALLATLGMM